MIDIIKQEKLEKIAQVLVFASLYGDNQAAKDSGLALRTIQHYKKRLREEPELAKIYVLKKQEFEGEWVNEVASTLLAGMNYIKQASQSEEKTPEMVHAIAGAMKIVGEIGLTKEIIDARIRYNLSDGLNET